MASQLIAQVPDDAAVSVVDRDPGSSTPKTLVLGNLTRSGITAVTASSGPQFVAGKLQTAIEDLQSASGFGALASLSADVVVAISKGWAGSNGRGLHVLAWNEND